jgi:hypothetical protein
MALRIWESRRHLRQDELERLERLLARSRTGGLTLAELRKVRDWTQSDVGMGMRDPQGVVSRRERQPNITVALIGRYLKALYAELVVIARFRNVDVRITQFDRADDGA